MNCSNWNSTRSFQTPTCRRRVTLSPFPCHFSSSSHLTSLHAAGALCCWLSSAAYGRIYYDNNVFLLLGFGWKMTQMPLGERSQQSSIYLLCGLKSVRFASLSNLLSFDRVNNLVFLFISTFKKLLSNAVMVPYLLCSVTCWNFLKVLWIMQLFSGVGTAQTCQKKLYRGNWKSGKFTSASI